MVRYNNVITFMGKIIGRDNRNYSPEELETMERTDGIKVYTDICGNYINLLSGQPL
jgi:hypothetical protein